MKPQTRKCIARVVMLLGGLMAIIGAYVNIHYSYDIDGVTSYTFISRVGEAIGYSGLGVIYLGYRVLPPWWHTQADEHDNS